MKIELEILDVLAASPRAIGPFVIAGLLPGQESIADVRRTLRNLQSKGDVKCTKTTEVDPDGQVKFVWKETDDGRLRIS